MVSLNLAAFEQLTQKMAAQAFANVRTSRRRWTTLTLLRLLRRDARIAGKNRHYPVHHVVKFG